ncbi:conserved hypothetical protein [Capnocytophaga canimorsus]|nr:conserved hypothetical protein [Capnocytophaga canimorsus]
MLCSGEQKILPIGRIKVSFEKERKNFPKSLSFVFVQNNRISII